MCTLSSVVSYAAMPELVAKKNDPSPPTTKASVRLTGHLSPRSCSRQTPNRYSPAAHTTSTKRTGGRPHSVKTVEGEKGGT